MLLLLVLVAACAPADGADPPLGSRVPAATLAPLPTPAATPTVAPSPLPTASAVARAVPALPAPPRATPTPGPSVGRVPVPAATPVAGRYAINLAKAADFVPQYTFEWCVGASIQMTRSIITGNRGRSRASQARLWTMARNSTAGSPYGGANPSGWAATLNDLGLGPYRLVSLPTFDAAVGTAARALADTGRPVGLVMWAGRHAWVMTGFESTADPRNHDGARVTRVRVMDPLYPHRSRWGPSPAPNRLIRLETLARQFVMRNRPDYDFGVDPGWLLVIPVS
jgi:hypothetical protein